MMRKYTYVAVWYRKRREVCLADMRLKDFRFDVGFFGAASINEEFQVTTPTHEKMWLKRQVPKQCARSYLAVDQSKFGKQSMTWINQLEDYTGVVTDREFLPEEVEVLKARRVRIIVV